MSVQIIRGNALALPLADDSVDLVVTSPPYFGLRSYQDGGEHYEGQIGAEATPAEFVDALIAATREMMRVVKPSGSIWVNLGDKYTNRAGGKGWGGEKSYGGDTERADETIRRRVTGTRPDMSRSIGMPEKSLIGIPWRYALRCIDDLGLILRAEVIWSKPNGLPESVTDRVRRSHEQWFHFTLEPRYYSAVDEVREAYDGDGRKRGKSPHTIAGHPNSGGHDGLNLNGNENPLGKLPSSVWEINEGDSLVRCVLSAIHAGSLTIDEGERLLKGQAWTGAHASGARSTSPATAGSGRQAAHPRDTASSGSTAGQSSLTGSLSNSATDPSQTGSSSTTCAASATVSGTLSPSPSGTTCSEDQAPSQRRTSSRLTAETGTSSPTPTPTGRQTAAASAANASAQRTADATGRPAQPQPDAPGSVWTIATEPLRVPDDLGVDHFAAFPTEFPRRIIQGWAPTKGVCVECGEGRRPVAGHTAAWTAFREANGMRDWHEGDERAGQGVNRGHAHGISGAKIGAFGPKHEIKGYACACPEPTAPTTPAVVLDPFGGTGTTALVADALGCHGISVDMSADYCRLAEWRTTDPKQRAKAARREFRPEPEQVDGQESLLDLIGDTA